MNCRWAFKRKPTGHLGEQQVLPAPPGPRSVPEAERRRDIGDGRQGSIRLRAAGVEDDNALGANHLAAVDMQGAQPVGELVLRRIAST